MLTQLLWQTYYYTPPWVYLVSDLGFSFGSSSLAVLQSLPPTLLVIIVVLISVSPAWTLYPGSEIVPLSPNMLSI